ncbi:putative leader peptide [Streptomyces sp. NPDC006552]|uniref:putative leader peptide n=1 Tax=Streptomyces sp. NPDC006552 TaxID=3157179 RepID=UPI0033A83669
MGTRGGAGRGWGAGGGECDGTHVGGSGGGGPWVHVRVSGVDQVRARCRSGSGGAECGASRIRRAGSVRPSARRGVSGVRDGVDRGVADWAWSCVMQPHRGRTVTLVARRHVDLVRVASAICRCA